MSCSSSLLITLILLPTLFLEFFTLAETGTSLADGQQRICANLIVKDEKPVIVRCLSSLTPIINYWVIVDTGSTDGTQEVIIDYMNSINMEGQLQEREWVGFSHNRNQAIDLAMAATCDYILVIDADEWIHYDDGFQLPRPLVHDYYNFTVSNSDLRDERILLFSTRHSWHYVGVLHEVLAIPQEATNPSKVLGARMIVQQDGTSSQNALKALDDAHTLEKALLEDSTNSRYVFYLAQSYRDAGLNQKAIEYYNKRIQMGGWDQELYYSLFSLARLLEAEQFPQTLVIASYQAALDFRPSRLEPLYFLAEYYRSKGLFNLCYQVSNVSILNTDDTLFVSSSVYEYALQFSRSICAYWIGEFGKSKQDSESVIANPHTPDFVRAQAVLNRDFAIEKISQIDGHEIKLNIGCGRDIRQGFINIDSFPLPGVDIVFDLESCQKNSLPFADNSVDFILMRHVIEHIDNVLPLMQELYRVAKPGAKLHAFCPYGSSDDADEDPTHVRRLFKQSWGYFSQPYYWRADYNYRGDWNPVVLRLTVRPGISLLNAKQIVDTHRNIIQEMEAQLEAIKPARPPERVLQRYPDIIYVGG